MRPGKGSDLIKVIQQVTGDQRFQNLVFLPSDTIWEPHFLKEEIKTTQADHISGAILIPQKHTEIFYAPVTSCISSHAVL